MENKDLILLKKSQKDKEKIVNKNNASFIKSLLYYLGYDFNYREYKSIVLGEIKPNSKTNFFLKSVYDAYIYLISNAKSNFILPIMKKYCSFACGIC